MNERITFISNFDNSNLEKINNCLKEINDNLCKVPFNKNISDRKKADTLPYHFTLSAWNITDKEKVLEELSKITFPKIEILINNIEIMSGKENSYVLYFSIKPNEDLKLLEEKIYQVLPSEKYNPKTFKFHITIHIDKDYQNIIKMKEQILQNFKPFKLKVNKFGLYEIYPAKMIKEFTSDINN